MRILVSNNHMEQYGGSETFTYTLIGELKRLGHKVGLFTFRPGVISDRIEEDFGVKIKATGHYDLVLASHNTTVNHIHEHMDYDFMVQTCHGVYTKMEEPSPYVDYYVAISKEVQDHLLERYAYQSYMIWNGIDCERFRPITPVNRTPLNVLSLSQSHKANLRLKAACDELGISLTVRSKLHNGTWNIEKEINKADIVVSLGRGAYEAMACGRPVLVYDHRGYSKSYADGFVNEANLSDAMINNCSGRFSKLVLDEAGLVNELKKYNSEDGDYLRTFALSRLNIRTQIEKYLMLKEINHRLKIK